MILSIASTRRCVGPKCPWRSVGAMRRRRAPFSAVMSLPLERAYRSDAGSFDPRTGRTRHRTRHIRSTHGQIDIVTVVDGRCDAVDPATGEVLGEAERIARIAMVETAGDKP